MDMMEEGMTSAEVMKKGRRIETGGGGEEEELQGARRLHNTWM